MTPAERLADALRRQRPGIKQHLMDRWDEITDAERDTLTERATRVLDAAVTVDDVQRVLVEHSTQITTDEGPDEFGYTFDADTLWFCRVCNGYIGKGDQPEEIVARHQADAVRAHLLNQPVPTIDEDGRPDHDSEDH